MHCLISYSFSKFSLIQITHSSRFLRVVGGGAVRQAGQETGAPYQASLDFLSCNGVGSFLGKLVGEGKYLISLFLPSVKKQAHQGVSRLPVIALQNSISLGVIGCGVDFANT